MKYKENGNSSDLFFSMYFETIRLLSNPNVDVFLDVPLVVKVK